MLLFKVGARCLSRAFASLPCLLTLVFSFEARILFLYQHFPFFRLPKFPRMNLGNRSIPLKEESIKSEAWQRNWDEVTFVNPFRLFEAFCWIENIEHKTPEALRS